MKNAHQRKCPATGFAPSGWMWCVCASILAWGLPARADEAGVAVLKSARWHAPAQPHTQGQTGLAVMPNGGPLITVIAGTSDGAVIAQDRASGKPLWTVAQNLRLIGMGEKSILVCKTGNTAAENRAFALSSKDGAVVYDLPLPQEYAFDVSRHVQVMGQAVVVQSNQRYTFVNSNPPPGVSATGGGPPVLTAYDLETGKELWKNNAPENTRVIYAFNPLLELRTNAEQRMLDSATGKIQWTCPLVGLQVNRTPITPAYLRSGDGTWYFLERPREGDPATNGYQLVTRDSTTGNILRQSKIEYAAGTPAAATGQLLVMRESRKSDIVREAIDVSRTVILTEEEKKDRLTALDIQTGKVVWKAAVFTDRPSTRMRVMGDVLLAGDLSSGQTSMPHGTWTMTVLDQTTGKTLWTNELLTDVVMYKELMIFALADQWVAVNRREGKPLWSIPCDPFRQKGDPLDTNPFTRGGRMNYAPCDPLIADGVLYLTVIHAGDEAGTGLFAIPLEGNEAVWGKKP